MIRSAIVLLSSGALAACVAAAPPEGSTAVGWIRNSEVTDEYQIAWLIAPVAESPTEVEVNRNRVIFRAPLLPERLFRTSEPVSATDGTLLLPRGMQLVLMDFGQFLVCSLARGEAGSAAATNRVCLLDETGDGVPDTYFLRSFGRSALTTDGMWFAMNRRMTGDRRPISGAVLAEIDRNQLTNKPEFVMRFGGILERQGLIRLRAGVDGMGFFEAVCAISGQTCVVPPVALRIVSRSGNHVRLAVAGANRHAHVRFDANYGSVGYEIHRVRISFDQGAGLSR